MKDTGRWCHLYHAIDRDGELLDSMLREHRSKHAEQSHRAVKQRYYPMLGFGSFESASQFCAAFDELQQYVLVRRRGEAHVSLTEPRGLFVTRWRSRTSELAAA